MKYDHRNKIQVQESVMQGEGISTSNISYTQLEPSG